MPSLQELFKSKKLSNNQTAQQKYDIQNSKENKPTSANPLMTAVAFPLQQIARRNLSAKGRETRLEEEVTGLRILKNVASPIIYGTEIIRLTTGTTTDLDTMKSAANGGGAGGVLSKFANKIKNSVSKVLGLPKSLIPSNLKLESDEFKYTTPFGYSEYFSKAKDSAAGSILGKFLNQTAKGGTPNQMGNQLIGGATQMVKDKIKKGLFGESTIGLATGGTATGIREDGKLSVFRKNKQGNKLYVNSSTELFNFTHYKYTSNAPYSSKFYVATETDYLKHYLEQVGVDDAQKDFTPLSTTILPKKPTAIKYINDYSATPYSTAKNGMIGTQNEYGDYVVENSLNNKRGFRYNELVKDTNGNYTTMVGNYGDTLNNLVAFSEADELKLNDYTKNLDFIPLKFYSVAKKSLVMFRATISGFSETLRPTWDPGKFVGNPFNYYTYSAIERTATFKFKIYSLSAAEHIAAWQRIKFLTSLVYPQGYNSPAKYVVPPFIKFTLGDLYHKKEGFIESLTYTVDDNYSWETGLNAIPGDSANGAIGQKELTNYKLPMIIDVDVSIKFVESAASHGSETKGKNSKGQDIAIFNPESNLYAFGKKADDAKKNIDGGGNPKTNTPASQPKAKDGAKKENPAKQTNNKVNTKTATGKKEYILNGEKVSQSTLEAAAGIKH